MSCHAQDRAVQRAHQFEERAFTKCAAFQVTAENKRLVEPLQRAKEEVEELRRQLANYDKDKQSLAVSRSIRRKIVTHLNVDLRTLLETCLRTVRRPEELMLTPILVKILSLITALELVPRGTHRFTSKL